MRHYDNYFLRIGREYVQEDNMYDMYTDKRTQERVPRKGVFLSAACGSS